MYSKHMKLKYHITAGILPFKINFICSKVTILCIIVQAFEILVLKEKFSRVLSHQSSLDVIFEIVLKIINFIC